jgi:hypothetical protein
MAAVAAGTFPPRQHVTNKPRICRSFGGPVPRHVSRRPAGWNRRRRERSGRRRRRARGPALVRRRERPVRAALLIQLQEIFTGSAPHRPGTGCRTRARTSYKIYSVSTFSASSRRRLAARGDQRARRSPTSAEVLQTPGSPAGHH